MRRRATACIQDGALKRPSPEVATKAATKVAPFLKWAGGKRSLLPEILRHVPERIDTYYEPFLGGGALFFALAARASGEVRPFRRAVLADTNLELISCYRTVRANVSGVIEALGAHEEGEGHYYRVRDQRPATLSDVKRAARTIYLNRNGFNGLFRVNRAGNFNVPFGKYSTLRTVKLDRLRAVSEALQEVTLEVCDFSACVRDAAPGDFVYFDPPYVPVTATSFTAYSGDGFGAADQRRLSELLRQLGAAGVAALLSNSDCELTRALYRGLPFARVRVARPINSVGSGRAPVGELIVRSFGYPC